VRKKRRRQTNPESGAQRQRRRRARLAALGALACVGVVAACSEEPVAPKDPLCDLVVGLSLPQQHSNALPDLTLALTFDDGPGDRTTELANYLRDQGVPAAFFINGANVEGREESLREIVRGGHLIANHTHTHPGLDVLFTEKGAAAVVEELEATDRIINQFQPGVRPLFRPPFGRWDADVHKTLSASAMNKYFGPVSWEIGDALTLTTAADWDCWDAAGNGQRTVEECTELYLVEIRSKRRGIVLFHDGPPGGTNDRTVDMVKRMVPVLKAEGFKFVRVDDLDLAPVTVPEAGTFGTTLTLPTDPCATRSRPLSSSYVPFNTKHVNPCGPALLRRRGLSVCALSQGCR
jgi:peptidoglycan-N-acetylglucosamine deacetylase